MLGYARVGDGAMCEKLLRDMEMKGMEINVIVYTTLINGLFKSYVNEGSLSNRENLEKCWKYYSRVT